MLRILALLMLLTSAAASAQQPVSIEPGQSLSGALGPDDRMRNDRPYDEYQYSAVPGTQVRVIARSRTMAVDVDVYFYDDYFDLIPLGAGGVEPEDTVDFAVPDAGSPTLVLIRVTTLADDPGPATGDYTIELSERNDP